MGVAPDDVSGAEQTAHSPASRRTMMRPRSELPRITRASEQPRSLHYFLAAACATVVSWAVYLLPDSASSYIARRIADLSYRECDGFRANVESNLRHVFDTPGDLSRVDEMTLAIFRANAENVLELLKTPHRSPEKILAETRVVSGSWQYVDDMLATGTGLIFVSAHLGAFDFIASGIQARGLDLTTLTVRTTSRTVFEAITYLRRSHDVTVLDASSAGIRAAVEALRRGGCVALLSDRDFNRSGRLIDFFGEPTTLPTGAARLARDTGACIVPIATWREDGVNALKIEQPFAVPRTLDREADIAPACERIRDFLESCIGAHADQWVMFQAVWPVAADSG